MGGITVNIHIATDNIGSSSHDLNNLNIVAEKLRAAGHQVTTAGRGDSAIQNHMKSESNKCDVMIQIAGGMCPGSFLDFNWGTRGGKECKPQGYYHADKFCIPIETSIWTRYSTYDPKKYKLPASAWDDSFSQGKLDKTYTINRTWQEISTDKEHFPRCIGFVEGNGGEEVAKNLISVLNGGGTTSGDGEQAGGGSSALDLIKQVCSDWDMYGVDLELNGDTVSVKRTQPSTAKPLTTSNIQLDSVSWTDYDSNTPNVYDTVKDKYLIGRFGEVPLDLETEDKQKADILQVAQRGHNHVVELKCILNKDFLVGKWVKLSIPELDISQRPYYISKTGYQEERLMQLTLESAPPSIYVEVPVEEETTEEGTDEEATEDEEDE